MLYFDILTNGNFLAEGTFFSAGTHLTFDKVKNVLLYHSKHKDEKKDTYFAVKALETAGFSLADREYYYLKDIYHNAVFRNRKAKDGKIWLERQYNPENPKETYDGVVTIDISTLEIKFNAVIFELREKIPGGLIRSNLNLDLDHLTVKDLRELEEAILQDEDCFNQYCYEDLQGRKVRFLKGPMGDDLE